MNTRLWIVGGALLAATLAAGVPVRGGEEAAPVPRLKALDLRGDAGRGGKIYLDSCWACHGLNGDGRGPAAAGMTPPPTDFSAPAAFKDRPDAVLYDAVLKGKPGTAMFAQPLDAQSAVDVVAFLKSLPRGREADRAFLDRLSHGDREAGRLLYSRRCWPCHGATGRGDGPAAVALRPPPADFTDPEQVVARTGARLYAALTRGVPGTAMAAQSLTEDEKFNVIAYLRSLVRYPEAEGGESGEAPKGDARAGRELYDKRCWACHGPAGDGDGPAAKEMTPPPTRFTDYEAMSRRSAKDWFNAIDSGVPGTAMYPQRLTEREVWDLVAHLRTLARRKASPP